MGKRLRMNYSHLVLVVLLISILFCIGASQMHFCPQSSENTTHNLETLANLPLSIDGNAQLAVAASSGDGSPATPYIIENKIINASGKGKDGIYIRNTTAYFILRNCIVTNAAGGAQYFKGVHLYNVTNARLENITAYKNYWGIYVESSSGNNLTSISADGVEIIHSHNNIIRIVNTSDIFMGTGVFLSYSNHNTLVNITADRNGYGILLDTSNQNTLVNVSACGNFNDGIDLWTSHNNTLKDSIANDNFDQSGIYMNSGFYLDHSNNNTLIRNIANRNNVGIHLVASNYTRVIGNTVHGNSICIRNVYSTGNILKNNDCGGGSIAGFNWIFILLALLILDFLITISKIKRTFTFYFGDYFFYKNFFEPFKNSRL